jgi:transcription-repair coupling factor (superfamily II helicase)
MDLSSHINKVLIAGITPYFLEKGNFWLQENETKILEARKTQSFFEDNIIYVEKNQELNLSQLLRKLDEMGYEKVYTVSDPGEFSHIGGTIDIFPINLNSAIRFEFLGNKIENIEKLPIEIKNEKISKEILKKKLKSQKLFSDLKGIKPGDYLVHLDHGIGIYKEILEMHEKKYYLLEYDANDKLYVPVELERKLSRYVGFSTPKISRLGSITWQKTKRKIKEDAEKFARELLEIYAKREITKRLPYLPDEDIASQFKDTFKYEETPDQLQVIEEIKKDMESDEPMDRIVCGDVGFGKTEVAARAIIKAVVSGRQVAMLSPTTILANQHFHNFKERLQNLPITIAILSRLQTKKEQLEIVKKLSEGKIDIIIGTHRILSKDINFKNLGLLILDDEQRFGVKQKEKFKKARESLDVLSLSATPIPRTLYMSLASLKNISLIQTPPTGRLAVKTFVMQWKKEIIKKAIVEEIKRGGQIYFLHNRVETIENETEFLKNLVPKAKLEVAHGRMKEKQLVKVIDDFENKKIDLLVATTIIENGLDLPNANTLIVDDATRLGLSQAYQIKGRVGRGRTQAFAYFLYPKKLKELARLRLNALQEAEELGSGYKIALRDLEIRGAGNILGREQSGSINKIGLNLYCQILSEAVEKIKGNR